MTFGQRLIDLREEKGIRQKELATLINVSPSTVSNYEHNVHYPDVAILCQLADYFNVSTDYLLARTDCRHNPNIFTRKLSKTYTVADFINTTLELSQKDVANLVEYVDLLVMRHQTTPESGS